DDLREHRPRMKLEARAVTVEHGDAEDVGGEQVAGELDALEVQPKRFRQRVRQRGLADARQVLDEQVAACEQAGQSQADLAFLAEDDAADLGNYRFERMWHVQGWLRDATDADGKVYLRPCHRRCRHWPPGPGAWTRSRRLPNIRKR